MADQPHVAAGVTRRRQEVAPGEFADEVYTRGAFDAAIANGRAYVLGTGRLTLAVAGNMRAQLLNPAGSGVVATVHAIAGLVTALGFGAVLLEPTAGIPATAVRTGLRLNRTTGAAAKTELRADTNTTTPVSGGTDTGVTVGLPAGARFLIAPLGLVLAPGQALGLNVNYTQAADGGLSFYVAEEAL